MRLYQLILSIPDDCDAEDVEIMAKCPKGSVSIFSEGFIGSAIYKCHLDPSDEVISLCSAELPLEDNE